jgi:hypothetical protein
MDAAPPIPGAPPGGAPDQYRTRGLTDGWITRLISASDLGEVLSTAPESGGSAPDLLRLDCRPLV